LFLFLPHPQKDPVFGFLTIATLIITWCFGWRAGALTLVTGGLTMLWYSLPGHSLWALLDEGVLARTVSNTVINVGTLVTAARIRHLEKRNAAVLKRERLLAERQAAALKELHYQVQLTDDSNAQLALALQAGSAGAFDAEVSSRMVRWTPESSALHGFEPEGRKLSYQQWLDCVYPPDKPVAEAAIQASMSTGEFSGEWRIRRGDNGEIRWISSRGKVFFNNSGEPSRMLGIDTDITERKLAQEALVRSEKLASVGRMAATVAHEINNPLETIMNSVYIATLDQNLSHQARSSLQIAEHELERVAHLTRQTLGFYRENTAPTKVDMSKIADGVLDLFAPKFRTKSVRVETRNVPGCCVHAVAGELRQVISNLIVNAVDASEPGSAIQVRTRAVTLAGRQCVRVSVADSGCGISRENMCRLFEPFFTTKQALGTGLGLWVSKGIVQKHHGWIRVRSSQNRGTIFSVYLPASEHARAAAATAARQPMYETA
jgi:PAS domain S-box-containing protein